MPSINEVAESSREIIKRQKFQIEQLQKDLHILYLRIKELNAKNSDRE